MNNRSKYYQRVFIALALLAIGAAGYWYLTDDSLKVKSLADGTEIFYFRGSSFDTARGFPENRLIESVDGEFYVRTTANDQPLILHTKLLEITVTGESGLRILANADKNGERVDVLYGQAHTEKRYDSPVQERVDMVGGQMMMINITIDFVEKEVLHDDEVPEWILTVEPEGIQRPSTEGNE
ncbi:hypothetical protein QP938_09545 [Porticoccaceae bacterium LTM1]|nr:hypothetical protein QP938_09545 [Porticoccaceae bacterium LTM1]